MDLQKPKAGNIYFSNYWKPLCCDRIDSLPVATALFDCGVLFGIGTSAIFAQKSLAENGFENIAIDGYIGPYTLIALNEISPPVFLKTLYLQFRTRIAEITYRNPRSAKYRNGWEDRIARFLALVS